MINATAKVRSCNKCGQEKPLGEFWLYQGKSYSRCIDCARIAHREAMLKNKFGITIEQYEDMLLLQNGVCAICENPPSSKRLCVDHCHETGIVRGLLCVPCNRWIGRMGDKAERVMRAVEYLQRSEPNG